MKRYYILLGVLIILLGIVIYSLFEVDYIIKEPNEIICNSRICVGVKRR